MNQNNHKPYALIEKDNIITRYDGNFHEFHTLSELQEFYQKQAHDIVFLTPFCSIRERGYESHGTESILAIEVTHTTKYTRDQIDSILSEKNIVLSHPIASQETDDEFIEKVGQIQQVEIQGGNICQMILSQIFEGKIDNFSHEDVESIFRNAIQQRGQYMTVLFNTGNGDTFISLTPEQHLHVTPDAVVMNPIAGTRRKGDILTLKERLLDFFDDTKERNELFQVLDEELKMMESICMDGGYIRGPFLRQNGAVIHTEYKIIGKRNLEIDPISMLRQTLHAPTLVGGPIENAARLITKYENQSRAYYGGEIGILTQDELDSAILIRMAHIAPDGSVRLQAGAGITKKSDPHDELEEVQLKIRGIQLALTGKTFPADVQAIIDDPSVIKKLHERNASLSKFHFSEQLDSNISEILHGKTVSIIDNEDNFTTMLARMIRVMGMKTHIIKNLDFDPTTDTSDIVLVGPGPGDINNTSDTKMKLLLEHVKNLLSNQRNILGICLGHQAIAHSMGMTVARLTQSKQGEQASLMIYDKEENLGFYNSFCPMDNTVELNILQRDNIGGFQFHPESVMSQNGFDLLRDELIRILSHRN